MAQKLWEKNVQVNEEIERFTVGRDREMDLFLAQHDVLGSMAHITMLESIGLLTADELNVLLAELKNIHAIACKGEFTIEEGVELVRLAEEKGLMLGGAPDTYMGAAIQTSRKLIEDGYIGTPIGAHAHMICHGHEGWHPDPEFYYKHGGGPMMDMGPYYVTALINLLGGVKKIAGMTKASFPTRTIKSQPHYGEIVTVDVPTYVTGIMEFDSGAIGTIFTTFDVYHDDGCKIEIYGTEGTLQVPDPNGFGGEVRLLRPEIGQYREVPHCFKYSDNSRGLGLADMAKALRTGRDFRSNYKQTMHVLEILETFKLSSESGSFIELKSKYTPGKPMINHPLDGIFED